jgi:hypothetical protein
MTLSLSEHMHEGRTAAQPQRHPMRRRAPRGLGPARTNGASRRCIVGYSAHAAYGSCWCTTVGWLTCLKSHETLMRVVNM